ncbi:hypothetical protein [Labrys miyagiensis]|uniref:hypothetical protein n=1 Tax=Labrys miyagiensis TaxID=346912 RepID=UPI0024E0618D|nr:hypothetical protein [Labrys miyagiensis]
MIDLRRNLRQGRHGLASEALREKKCPDWPPLVDKHGMTAGSMAIARPKSATPEVLADK